ncbi:hypothetical protein K501DRAFT_188203 [Backusella circina FSU 941]|nr:hypothetical protein K501DRAFT_188203 [Backusella circina FSU 941]
MKTLRQLILIYANQDAIKSTWDHNLRLIRFVYSNTYHTSIKATPFELVHGRIARSPSFVDRQDNDIQWPDTYRGMETLQSFFAKELHNKLEQAFTDVYKTINEYEDSENKLEFNVGDKVMMFNMQLSSKNKPRKLAYDWVGSWSVVSELSITRFDLKNNVGKKVQNIHISMIKPYYK